MKWIFFIFIILILSITACAKQQTQQNIEKPQQTASSEDVSALAPEQVVILYFQAWSDEQYDVMYTLVSDGFKQLEPTAKTFDDFKSYMEKFYDTALDIKLVEAKGTYAGENEAGVEYKIEITGKDGSRKEFSSTYTLKKRANGWKLIHPYGENIDMT